MVKEIQDLVLPNTVVTRLVKEALPDGINIGKEARTAISRAAAIFIIYLTSTTAAAARKQKHKSLSSDNVFTALEEIEFESFIQPLRESLESFRKISKDKKAAKSNGNKSTNETNETDIDDIDDDAIELHSDEVAHGTEIEE